MMSVRELGYGDAGDHDRDDDQDDDQPARDQRRRKLALPRRVLCARRPGVLVSRWRSGWRRGEHLLRQDRRSAAAAEPGSRRERRSASTAETGGGRGHRHQAFTVVRARPCLEAAARAAPPLGQNRIVGTMWWHSGHGASGPISRSTPSTRSASWITLRMNRRSSAVIRPTITRSTRRSSTRKPSTPTAIWTPKATTSAARLLVLSGRPT